MVAKMEGFELINLKVTGLFYLERSWGECSSRYKA